MTSYTNLLAVVLLFVALTDGLSISNPLVCTKPNPVGTFYRINATGGYELVKDFSYFNPSAPTFFVVHGWLENRNSNQYQLICNDLKMLHGGNVAMLDYGVISQEFYGTCATFIVETVGTFLGQNLINAVQSNKTTPEQIHLIGHSLGAHISGKASQVLKAATGKPVRRISGLDPAGPYFEYPLLVGTGYALNKTDATFVDCLHTTSVLGSLETVGVVDFYSMGLADLPLLQKPCLVHPEFVCSHTLSKRLFRASINYKGIVGQRYTGPGPKLSVYGYFVDQSLSGIYYFRPSFFPPYGCGQPFC